MELEKSKKKRQNYISVAWINFIIFAVFVPTIGLLGMIAFPADEYHGGILSFLLGMCILVAIPNLCIFGGYLLYCYGRSKTQTMHLYDDMAVYSYYSGSLYRRETYNFYIKKLKGYKKTKRNIRIFGEFEKQTADKFGYHDWIASRITIPRTFEQEQELFAFFDKILIK